MSERRDKQDANGHAQPYHVPVMLSEVLEWLDIKPGGTYVDCTFGGGGHSKAILSGLNDEGRLYVFDQDEDAQRNLPDDPRLVFIPHNFRHLQRFMKLYGVEGEVDGILADLGVSSHQFDEGSRGFSIRFDAPLDMRMDARQPVTAAEIIRTYSEQSLHKLFERYGEVTNAKTLARLIVTQREIRPMETISQFREAVKNEVKGNPNKYFAQVFQALRMEVNDETGALADMLRQSVQVLKPGGRIAVITFHSIEDRLVKNFFRYGSTEEPSEGDMFGNRPQSQLQVMNKKPVIPHESELRSNPRSRSAKLRIAQKKQPQST